jgi:hypothetical protein
MAIAAEPSSPSGLPSAVDWAAVSVAAALETSITTAAIVASAAVAIAITKHDDHPSNGHNVNNCQHDGYKGVILDNSHPSLLFLSNNNKGNAFPTRHALSNADAVATTTAAAIAAAAAADNEGNDNDNVRIHPPPQPTAAVGGDMAEAAGTTSKRVAVSTVISSAAKISLCAYFEGSAWLLNKTLLRGAEFLCGPLGDIVRQYCLKKMQVARQLLNYKKGKFMNMQVSILLNQSNLDERIRDGMTMSAPKFVSSTLLRICDPDPSSYGSYFSNLCVVMNSLLSTARRYIRLLASSPDDACFCLLVDVVENWI